MCKQSVSNCFLHPDCLACLLSSFIFHPGKGSSHWRAFSDSWYVFSWQSWASLTLLPSIFTGCFCAISICQSIAVDCMCVVACAWTVLSWDRNALYGFWKRAVQFKDCATSGLSMCKQSVSNCFLHPDCLACLLSSFIFHPGKGSSHWRAFSDSWYVFSWQSWASLTLLPSIFTGCFCAISICQSIAVDCMCVVARAWTVLSWDRNALYGFWKCAVQFKDCATS